MLENILASTAIKKILDLSGKPFKRRILRFTRLSPWGAKRQLDYQGDNDLATYKHYLNDLTQVAVGRRHELNIVIELLEGVSGCRILVEGPSGFGKTTFFALLKEELEERNSKLLWHMFSRNFVADVNEDVRRFDNNIAEQLAYYLGVNYIEIRNKTSFVIDTLADPPQNFILLVDALDETDTRLLSSRIPKHLHGLKLVVTSRTIGNDSAIEGLGLYRKDLNTVISMPPLLSEDIQQLLKQMDLPSNNAGKVMAISKGDPFFVRFLLEDIRDGRIDDIDEHRPPSVAQYLERQFEILTEGADDIQARILAQIVLSPTPIPRKELISTINGLSGINFKRQFRPLARFFIETDLGYIVCHNRFKEFFAEQLD